MSDDLLVIVMVSPLKGGPESDEVAAWAVRLCGPVDVSSLSRGIQRASLFDASAPWQGPWNGPSWASPADIYKDLDDLGWSALDWLPQDAAQLTSVWSRPVVLAERCP